MNTDNSKTILLVEDEAIIAMMEKNELEKYGYIVHSVTTGEKAVQTIAKNTQPIDLILMDINLGSGIDGTRAAEKILKEKDIPIVFLSSHTEPEIVEKTEKITSYGYVIKNSGSVVLDASIKMALRLSKTKRKQKQAEETLTEQKNLLSAIYRNAPLIMMVVNAERRIQQVNGFATQFANRDTEEMLGLHGGEALRCVHAMDDPKGCGFGEFCKQCVIRNTILDTLETEEGHSQIEAPYSFKEQDNETQEFYLLMSTTPIEVKGERMVLVTLQNITERRHAEKKLRKSIDKLHSIYRAAPTGIGLVTNRVIKEVNQRICNMTGYTREELIEKNAQILYPTRDEYEYVGKEKYKQIQKFGIGEVETLWQKKDGTIINILLASTPIDIKDHSKGVTFTALDITERKQKEKKLYYKESIIESADSVIAACDLEGKMTYANQNFFAVWGFENQAEFIGHHLNEFWAVEDRLDEITSALLNEGTWSDDIKALRKDGTLFDVHVKTSAIFDTEGNRIGFMSTTIDITERKRAEDALKYKSKRMDFILKATRTNINILDPEYNLREVDDLWQNIYGDPIGKKCYEYFMGFDKPCPDCGVPRAMATRKTVIYEEFLPKENRYIEVHTIPFHSENSEWLAIEFNIDITERKQAEVEIKRQLSEKETLLREVHHRIKNNISSIESLLTLQAGSTENEETKVALQASISRIQSTRVLYEKLLLGKDYQDVSIKSYLESLIDSLVAVFPESKNVCIEKNIINFTISSKKAIPIGIIINELMTNIFKHAFNKNKAGNILIKVNKTKNQVTLTVKDNGIGINERVKANKSPGFGLTIVKMLAEQLEGTFTMGNDNGMRSVLKFEI